MYFKPPENPLLRHPWGGPGTARPLPSLCTEGGWVGLKSWKQTRWIKCPWAYMLCLFFRYKRELFLKGSSNNITKPKLKISNASFHLGVLHTVPAALGHMWWDNFMKSNHTCTLNLKYRCYICLRVSLHCVKGKTVGNFHSERHFSLECLNFFYNTFVIRKKERILQTQSLREELFLHLYLAQTAAFKPLDTVPKFFG